MPVCQGSQTPPAGAARPPPSSEPRGWWHAAGGSRRHAGGRRARLGRGGRGLADRCRRSRLPVVGLSPGQPASLVASAYFPPVSSTRPVTASRISACTTPLPHRPFRDREPPAVRPDLGRRLRGAVPEPGGRLAPVADVV